MTPLPTTNSIDPHSSSDSSSGRKFWEMTFPAGQPDEAALNFKNWPYVFATRKFPRPLLKSPISQRHVSRYLTYPYTIASMLYNPWTYYDDEGQRKRTVTDSGWHLLSGME